MNSYRGPKVDPRLDWYYFIASGAHIPMDFDSFYHKTPIPILKDFIKLTKHSMKKGFLNNQEIAVFKATARTKGAEF